jgi:hypothetical protein
LERIATTLASKRRHCGAAAEAMVRQARKTRFSKHECGQLIERVDRFQTNNDECKHQYIKANMHLVIATRIFPAAARVSRQAVNQTRYARGINYRRASLSPTIGREGFRRRGSDAFVANPFFGSI